MALAHDVRAIGELLGEAGCRTAEEMEAERDLRPPSPSTNRRDVTPRSVHMKSVGAWSSGAGSPASVVAAESRARRWLPPTSTTSPVILGRPAHALGLHRPHPNPRCRASDPAG